MKSKSRSGNKPLGLKEALAKIEFYCAYQERSHAETRAKLFCYGLSAADVDEAMCILIEQNFLNEQRFATTFAGSKFRMLGWGKIKIKIALEQRDVTPKCIQTALNAIESSDYLQKLKSLLEKKAYQLGEISPFEKNQTLFRYALQKGYESDIIRLVIHNPD